MLRLGTFRNVLFTVPLSLLLTATASAQVTFYQTPTYPANGLQVSADFNGDGNLDLIAADGTVLLGKGDGTFNVGTSISVPGPYVTGDFNGDGKPDLALMNADGVNLTVLLGNGDGTFQVPINIFVGTTLTLLVAADVNGDGKTDMLGYLNATNQVVVFLSKGDGTFAAGVGYVGAPSTFEILTGDFNGDGKVDIATLGSSVGVLLGNGDGTFQKVITTSVQCSNALVGDFNGDGKLDIVGIQSGGIVTLLGNGNGTFQTAVHPVTFVNQIYGQGTADLNGDGKLDLVLSSAHGYVQIFLGNGDGTFTERFDYTANVGVSNVIIGDLTTTVNPILLSTARCCSATETAHSARNLPSSLPIVLRRQVISMKTAIPIWLPASGPHRASTYFWVTAQGH